VVLDTDTQPVRLTRGVALTGALIVTPLLLLTRWQAFLFFLYDLGPLAYPIVTALTGIWTALAGAIGLRKANLSWRQTVLAAVLAGAAVPMIASFLVIVMSSQAGGYAFLILFPALFAGLFWVSAGVFLLPLFDPVVRRAGPALSTWKVVATALLLSAPFLATFFSQRTSQGNVTFFPFPNGLISAIPILLSGILLAGGVILALSKRSTVIASWLGGVGLIFLCFMLIGSSAVVAVMSR
jgi:hypothetical protein